MAVVVGDENKLVIHAHPAHSAHLEDLIWRIFRVARRDLVVIWKTEEFQHGRSLEISMIGA